MRGFSLIEMLLSIAIMAIIAGLTAPVYFSYQINNEFSLAVDAGAQSLRRAQNLAQNTQRDSNWGVYFATSSITIYSGASYAARISSSDETYSFPSTVTSTVVDINFSKMTGGTSVATATISSNSGSSKNITVNGKGMVDY